MYYSFDSLIIYIFITKPLELKPEMKEYNQYSTNSKLSTSRTIKKKSHRHHHKKSSSKRKHSYSQSSKSSSSSQSKISENSSATTQSCHYKFKLGQKIGHKYRIKKLLGDGTFGRVVLGEYNRKLYAIKIIRPVEKYIDSAKTEKDIIKRVNKRDEDDREGIVRYKHSFYHNDHYCLVFKPLGRSLYDVIKINEYRGFPIHLVQKFFKQMLKSVAFLHRIGYTHTDLKPENILLEKEQLIQDQKRQYNYQLPKYNRIRIIDFGGATKYDQFHSSIVCTRQYRPPEVILECCGWNELVDVWSIGCIVMELYTGDLLFPTHNDYQHLKMIEKNSGLYPSWMINKTPSNLKKIFKDGQVSEKEVSKHLQHLENIYHFKTYKQICTGLDQFRDLIRQCLEIDPNRRITCSRALTHPFFEAKFQPENAHDSRA